MKQTTTPRIGGAIHVFDTDRRSDPRFSIRIGGAIRDTRMFGSLFDPKAAFFNHERMRPHWSQAGAIVFVTARTHDSLPHEVIRRWEQEKSEWLDRLEKKYGISLGYNRNWKERLLALDEPNRQRFLRHFNRQRERELDICHGACLLRRPEYAKIVADSLMRFDGTRYRMGDFVVMPNHFHALVVFAKEEDMEKQFDSWLHWTATQINRRTGIRGHFWQQEPFDHLVRSVKQYNYLRQYIADNPKKAKLSEGEYYYRRLEE